MRKAQAHEILRHAKSRPRAPNDLRGGKLSWQDKILNEPRLGYVKEHGSKRRPVEGRK